MSLDFAVMKKTKPTKEFKHSLAHPLKAFFIFIATVSTIFCLSTGVVYAGTTCGAGEDKVETHIDFGCTGKGNPIIDLSFAIIRFLSIGVGIVVVASLIVAGIQYTSSSGDPQATAKALKRIANTVAALVLYLFIFAILNWLVPAGLLK